MEQDLVREQKRKVFDFEVIGFFVQRALVVVGEENHDSADDQDNHQQNPDAPNDEFTAEAREDQIHERKRKRNEGAVEKQLPGVQNVSDDSVVDFGGDSVEVERRFGRQGHADHPQKRVRVVHPELIFLVLARGYLLVRVAFDLFIAEVVIPVFLGEVVVHEP
ncbi:MAG: hypothetical protein AAF242_04765 [Bacteroidota bacterium]